MRKGRDFSPSAPSVSSRSDSSRDDGHPNGHFNGDFVDHVRQRAYELYEERVNKHFEGDPMSDWLAAEEQVRLELSRGNDILA